MSSCSATSGWNGARRRANVPTLPTASNSCDTLVDERSDALVERAGGADLGVQDGSHGGQLVGDGDPAQVVDVVEVAEHGPRGEPGAGGDGVGARRHLAGADQLEEGVDDRVAVAISAEATSVGGRHAATLTTVIRSDNGCAGGRPTAARCRACA